MERDPRDRRHFFKQLGCAGAGVTLGPAVAKLFAQADTPAQGGPADPPRELQPTGGANLGSLFPDVERLAAGQSYTHSFLGDRFKSLDEFKQSARAKLLEVLLYRPDKVDPRPEVLEKVDCGDYTRERIVFSTSPTLRVPAYVLVPKNLKRPAPAIVDLHSHGGMFLFGKEKVIDFGKNHPAMVIYHQRNYDGRPTSTQLVRRGYVVISIDTFLFGERRPLRDEDLKYGWDRSKYTAEAVAHLNQSVRAREQSLVKGLIFAGLTWPGIVFWDDMRTVDYLASREEVDPKRIGCMGISMGGYRSMFLSGLDERIAAACVVGFMSTTAPMIKAHCDTHSWVHFLPNLHRYMDWPDVVSMMAPKPLMVLQCAQDKLFPPNGMRDAITRIAAAFEKAGMKDQFAGRFYEEPHKFSLQMQDDAFAFFDRHLKPGT